MSEHTEAGKECIARVVHELVPTIERDFWQDDPHNGDVRQHLSFWIEGEPDAYHIAFMSSSLADNGRLVSRWREIRACNDHAYGESKSQNSHDSLLDLTFLIAATDPKAPIY